MSEAQSALAGEELTSEPMSPRDGPPPALRLHAGGSARSLVEAMPHVNLEALDDAALVVRTQAGDRSAFEQLVRRTGRLLFSRLYLETSDAHLAEDLVQEAYLVAWRSIEQVSEPAGFRSWLFSVAHSVRIDAARRGKRKKRGSAAKSVGEAAVLLAGVPDAGPSPEESLQAEEQRRRVIGMLRSMPEEYREVITLRYLGGADYETIGRQLGLSNGSLRGLLNRGMAKLREMAKGNAE